MNILNIYVLILMPYVRNTCSKLLDEHIEHLRAVFGALCEACLFANLEKCTFYTGVAFLGYVVTPQGIEVDEAKIEAIKSWPIPATLT
jgi:hypothetical protein